ncbi:MAG: succinyl-diaminopimelate desuccinylase [Streptosporangiales bacterium]|nr:succinyl-diaminopimelate desuccinylase [Streptosporangiales bacterium]
MDLDLSSDVVTLTAALVDIASVSGDEKPLADAVERALTRLPHLTTRRTGNTLVARTNLGRQERVVLAGHLDTVPHADNFPSKFSADGTVLHGVGSGDMKAGVAIQLKLAHDVTEPGRDLTYVFYECEEIQAERNGLYKLSRSDPDQLAGDFAILLEGSNADIEGGCQGTLRAEITVKGARAHTARSWMGRNAIHAAGEILDILRAWEPRQPVVDGIQYHEGLNAVAVTGGVAGNVVPDECVVTVNYRFAPDKSAAEAEACIRELFGAWPVKVVDLAPGARPGLTAPVAASFREAVGGEARAKLGWTDVARFSELGIPAVNYGPGDPAIAHTPGEFVEVARIRHCEQRLRAWLR